MTANLDAMFRLQSNMSEAERRWQDMGYLVLQDEVAHDVSVAAMCYEWMSFNVPGGRYTPDFFMLFSDGSVSFVEIKEESITYHKDGRVKKRFLGRSYRDSRAKLRAAADLNPWFTFYMAFYNRSDGTWRIEKIKKGKEGDWIDGTKFTDEGKDK